MGSLLSVKGRVTRSAWWGRVGIALLIPAGFGMLTSIVLPSMLQVVPGVANSGFGLVLGLLFIVSLMLCWWVAIAASVRRLHDMDRSGLWLLLAWGVVPLGGIVLGTALDSPLLIGIPAPLQLLSIVVLGAVPGTHGPNQYGADVLDPLAELGESDADSLAG